MVTYYAAQLGISLSVVDSKASYLDSMDNGHDCLRLKQCGKYSINYSSNDFQDNDSEYNSEASSEDDFFQGLKKKYPISSF